uniref:Uncharacterized protein n=1 Tax=Pararge aegeria TaxID=116150 RepID=S4P5Q1_9NEOP
MSSTMSPARLASGGDKNNISKLYPLIGDTFYLFTCQSTAREKEEFFVRKLNGCGDKSCSCASLYPNLNIDGPC